MPLDYTDKRRALAAEMGQIARRVLVDVDRLGQIREEIAECGGGFVNADFENENTVPTTGLEYLGEWEANTFVTIVAPALDAALDGHLQGNAEAATLRQIILKVKQP